MPASADHLPPTPHCPTCDYNLSGNTSGRCPECGTPVAYATRSRLPWLTRHLRGGARSYWQMTALVLLNPRRLAAEAQFRVRVRHAKRFHHEATLLAVAMGCALLTVAFLLRGARFERWLEPTPGYVFSQVGFPVSALYASFMFVLADSLLVILPLIATVYLALYVSTFLYRQMIVSLMPPSLARRRAYYLAYYASAISPVLTTLLGAIVVAGALMGDRPVWIGTFWASWVMAGAVLCGGGAVLVHAIPTYTLLRRLARCSILRSWVLTVLFPVLQVPLWVAITIVIFWFTGYLSLAVWSMTH